MVNDTLADLRRLRKLVEQAYRYFEPLAIDHRLFHLGCGNVQYVAKETIELLVTRHEIDQLLERVDFLLPQDGRVAITIRDDDDESTQFERSAIVGAGVVLWQVAYMLNMSYVNAEQQLQTLAIESLTTRLTSAEQPNCLCGRFITNAESLGEVARTEANSAMQRLVYQAVSGPGTETGRSATDQQPRIDVGGEEPIAKDPSAAGGDADAEQGEKDTPTDDGSQDYEYYVTMLQMAAMVNRRKRTIERLYKDGKLGEPDVIGGGRGKPNEWKWSRVRPVLMKEYDRDLPLQFPADEFRKPEEPT